MCVKNLFAIAVSIMFCSWVVMMWARSSLFRPDKFKVVNSTSDTTKVLKTDLMFLVEVTPIVLTKNFWGHFISLCVFLLIHILVSLTLSCRGGRRVGCRCCL